MIRDNAISIKYLIMDDAINIDFLFGMMRWLKIVLIWDDAINKDFLFWMMQWLETVLIRDDAMTIVPDITSHLEYMDYGSGLQD